MLTQSHMLGELLAACAELVVVLSAAPEGMEGADMSCSLPHCPSICGHLLHLLWRWAFEEPSKGQLWIAGMHRAEEHQREVVSKVGERAGGGQPGEGIAPGRPHCILLELEGSWYMGGEGFSPPPPASILQPSPDAAAQKQPSVQCRDAAHSLGWLLSSAGGRGAAGNHGSQLPTVPAPAVLQ